MLESTMCSKSFATKTSSTGEAFHHGEDLTDFVSSSGRDAEEVVQEMRKKAALGGRWGKCHGVVY